MKGHFLSIFLFLKSRLSFLASISFTCSPYLRISSCNTFIYLLSCSFLSMIFCLYSWFILYCYSNKVSCLEIYYISSVSFSLNSFNWSTYSACASLRLILPPYTFSASFYRSAFSPISFYASSSLFFFSSFSSFIDCSSLFEQRISSSSNNWIRSMPTGARLMLLCLLLRALLDLPSQLNCELWTVLVLSIFVFFFTSGSFMRSRRESSMNTLSSNTSCNE